MKHIGIILYLILFIVLNTNAQTGKVFPKTNVKKGKLKNGLTYYVYKNPSSKGKISYYLIQNVGAILEEENENGISHFLEHMCFNGTKNFPGNSIMEMFEQKNLLSCVNAHTGVDKTVYHFINVPTKYSSLCDKCLLAIRDWCSDVTFPQEKINTERLVILEEKRTRNTPESRFTWKNKEATLCNSKYTKRDIIGTEEVIKNVNRDDFIKYYNTWYRPDLQAIVVIGEVNVYEIETKIKNLFSTIESKENAKERYHIDVPDNKETIYKQIVDSESQKKEIRIKYRHKIRHDEKVVNCHQLINYIVQNRINEILKDNGHTSINYLKISRKNIAQNYFNYGIELGYKKNKAKEALTTTIGVYKDILENGFTNEEYDRAVKKRMDILTVMKDAYSRIPDDRHVKRIEQNFINNMDLIDYGTELKNFRKIVKELTPEYLKNEVNNLYSGCNKSIVVVDKDSSELLSKEEIIEIEKKTKPVKYNPNKTDDKTKDEITIAKNNVIGSKIIKKEKLGIENASVWTLKNGAKVIYKECTTNENILMIRAFSNGGYSLLSGEDLFYANMFKAFVGSLGIKDISENDFKEFIKKNKLQYQPIITNNDESLTIKCLYENSEEALQLLCNLFENPIFYKENFDITKNNIKTNLDKMINQYQYKIKDTLGRLKYDDRYISLDVNSFNKFSIDKMEKVYKNRFSNANDFIFYIIGSIGESKARKMAEKYIGSISSTDKKESYKKLDNKFPTGNIKIRLKYDIESNKSGVIHIINSQKDLTDKEKICFKLLKGYLREKLTNVIRKLENGTYSVSVVFYNESKSLNNYGFSINFDCDPKRAEELNKKLNLALSVIADRGLQQIDLDVLKKPYSNRKHIDKDKIRKGFKYYSVVLPSYVEQGKNLTDPNYSLDLFNSIDLEYINKVLQEFFKNADILNVIYSPN